MVPCLNGDLVELWLEEPNLHAKLSPGFQAEIAARKQAAVEWGQHRQDHSETLSEMPPRLHHYLYMDRALPMMVYKDPGNFVRLLDSPVGGKFLYCVWDAIGNALDPSEYITLDWHYAKYSPKPDMDILCLRFSPPTQEAEVWMVAVVVTPGKKQLFLPASPQCRFYTLETGLKARDGGQFMFWEWEKGLHRTHSHAPATTDELAFVKMVAADNGIPVAGS